MQSLHIRHHACRREEMPFPSSGGRSATLLSTSRLPERQRLSSHTDTRTGRDEHSVATIEEAIRRRVSEAERGALPTRTAARRVQVPVHATCRAALEKLEGTFQSALRLPAALLAPLHERRRLEPARAEEPANGACRGRGSAREPAAAVAQDLWLRPSRASQTRGWRWGWGWGTRRC